MYTLMQHILFDLDGTLTDPAEGITGAVAYALQNLGHTPPPRKELEQFIGPPLSEAFGDFYNFSPEKTEEAIVLFREYFTRQGIHENEIFPGIPQLLQGLVARGKTLHVATTKPTFFAHQVLQAFDIAPYFTTVEGSPLEHAGLEKALVVQAVLNQQGIPPEDAVMIGDRRHDVIGARKNNVRSIGVLYGYGSLQEMQEAAPDYLAGTVEDLGALLLQIAP